MAESRRRGAAATAAQVGSAGASAGDPRAALDLDSTHRAVFAAYPDALLLVDARGRVVLANPAAVQLLGYAEDELVGLAVEELVPDAVRARHADHRASYRRQPRPRPMGTQMALSARRRDGSEVMVEIALSPLPPEPARPGPPLVVAAIRGVGEYPRVKQALQRARYSECVAEIGRRALDGRDPQPLLREAVAAAARALHADQAVLYRLEPSGGDLRVAAAFGVDAAASALEPEDRLLPNRPDTPWGHAMAQARTLVVADYRHERRFVVPRAFLEIGLVSGIAVPLVDRGRTVGLLAARSRRAQPHGEDEAHFLQSLANLLASSLQRAASEEALAHAQRLESIGQLSGGVAHDFNNLLTVILGNLQVLAELPSTQDESAQELVAAATRAGKRGAELTAKLLAFSRRQVLQPTRVDAAALLQSLADMLRRTLDQRIQIAVDVEPDAAGAAPGVMADAAQLESALLNLAINARDAMPDGGLLGFSARVAGDEVVIAVADNGIGMRDEVRERAFEPFFTTKEKGRGTGLGLSTVYGFVTQSKGTVAIASAPGRGTTVSLRIPRWREALPAAAAGRAHGTALRPGLRVLLVEDDAEVCKVVAASLAALGCSVEAAADADQALALLGRAVAGDGAFELLLSDVALGPGLRGSELARRARQQAPGLAVLLMSGFASELNEAERAPALPWELLHKPFTREDLARSLERALLARG